MMQLPVAAESQGNSALAGRVLDDAAASALEAHLQAAVVPLLELAQKFAKRAGRVRLTAADVKCAFYARAFGDGDDAAACSRAAERGDCLSMDAVRADKEPAAHAPRGPRLLVQRIDTTSQGAESKSAERTDRELLSIISGLQNGDSERSMCLVGPALMSSKQQDLLSALKAAFREDAERMQWEQASNYLRSLLHGDASSAELKDIAGLRPFLAQFLAHKAPALGRGAPVGQLAALLDALEVIGSAAGAELYLHQCLILAVHLCIAPRLGGRGPANIKLNALEVQAFTCIRKRAANIIGRLVSRLHNMCPELCEEIASMFEHALQSLPPLGTVAGAVFGLTELGATCISKVLLPMLLCEGGVRRHIENAVAKARSAGTPSDIQLGQQDVCDAFAAFQAAASLMVSVARSSAREATSRSADAPRWKGQAPTMLSPRVLAAMSSGAREAVALPSIRNTTGKELKRSVEWPSNSDRYKRLRHARLFCNVSSDAFGTDVIPLLSTLSLPCTVESAHAVFSPGVWC